ncbi:MAG: Type 1 glutamine amidotransferase-like domain-containing protein [bacterium]
MPTLFLTSAGLPPETREHFLSLLDKKPADVVVAFIPTAAWPEKNHEYIQLAKNELRELGINRIKEVDLKSENKQSLLEKLADCDVIYVNGGNTFYLLEQARKSGFTEIIRSLLDQGKIYLGVSAGSYLACPTILAAGWGQADENVANLADLTALNLVPFIIVAHFQRKEREEIENEAKKVKYPVIALNDQQAILVKDGSYEIIGSGDKISFNGFKEN